MWRSAYIATEDWYMVWDFIVRVGQIILVLIILVFVGYRLALIFNWVPEDFSPGGLIVTEYKAFKIDLHDASSRPGSSGKIAKVMINNIERIEKYYEARQKLAAEEEALLKECNENDLFRFFMFLGDDKAKENQECMERNLRLKQKVDEATAVTQ